MVLTSTVGARNGPRERPGRARSYEPDTDTGSRNNNSTIKKARLRFFVFLNKKETTQVACFNSHKKGKEPHPAFLHCGIVEAAREILDEILEMPGHAAPVAPAAAA